MKTDIITAIMTLKDKYELIELSDNHYRDGDVKIVLRPIKKIKEKTPKKAKK